MSQRRVTLRLPVTAKVPAAQIPQTLKKQRGRFHETSLRVPSDVAIILSMVVMAVQAGAIIVALIAIAAVVASFFFA